jgi:membrane associated rhomboid family serine protease
MALYDSLKIPTTMVMIFWCIELLKFVGIDLTEYGIYPRHFSGLVGVIFSPFLHGNISHLMSNTPTFIVLMTAVIFFYPRMFLYVIPSIWLLSGLGVWLFGRSSIHIGASGLIYGLVTFLIFSGIFRKDFKSLTIAVVVIFLYGGLIYGVLPGQRGVSWESHLIGGIAGIVVANLFSNHKADKDTPETHDSPFDRQNPKGYSNIETKRYKYFLK